MNELKAFTTEGTHWIFNAENLKYMRVARDDRVDYYTLITERLLEDTWLDFAYVQWAEKEIIERDGARLNLHTAASYDHLGIYTGVIVEGLDHAQWLVDTCGKPIRISEVKANKHH